jgi:4-hydroxybenzoate polyprenyltransferase
MKRWIVYQRERFPLAAHAPLVAAFSTSAVCFSSVAREGVVWPSPAALGVAFATSLLFFLQLRIADEFKDSEDDRRFRPYRPVPRGLVTLRELACVAVAAAALQLGLALWLDPPLVWLLALTWLYLALMSREFFVASWLRRHQVVYMASHMAIVPLIDLYATACDWRVAGVGHPPAALSWFLIVSFLNGCVVEIGRKTRAPADEEEGVETYSALWGMHAAARAWLAVIVLTAFAAWRASAQIGGSGGVGVLLLGLAAACAITAGHFVRRAAPRSGRRLEVMSGVWTFLMYVALGPAPLALGILRSAR